MVDWATVGICWTISTITTIIILLILFCCQRWCKRINRTKRKHIEREAHQRHSDRSTTSKQTKVSIISHTDNKHSGNRQSGGSGRGGGSSNYDNRTRAGSGNHDNRTRAGSSNHDNRGGGGSGYPDRGGVVDSYAMGRSVSREEKMNLRNRRLRGDAVSQWCNEHNLSENTAQQLRDQGFYNERELEALRPIDVPGLGLNMAEECLLRSVLAQKHINTDDESRSRSQSLENLAEAGDHIFRQVSEQHPSGGANEPLLARSRSYQVFGKDEAQSIEFEAGMVRQRSAVDKSYEVIDDAAKKPLFGAQSCIKLVPGPNSPIESPTGMANGSRSGATTPTGRSDRSTTPTGRPERLKNSSSSQHNNISNQRGFNGLLSDHGLYDLASDIGGEWPHLATLLGITPPLQEQIRMDHPSNTKQQIWEMLRLFRDTSGGSKEMIKGKLHRALSRVHREDLANRIMKEQVDGSAERIAVVQSVV